MKAEISQTVELDLDLELILALQQHASVILDLQADAKVLNDAIAVEKEALEARLKETGQDKLVLGEYRFALTPGFGRMSQADLIAAGVTPTQIAQANNRAKQRKGKASLRVGLASDKEVTENAE